MIPTLNNATTTALASGSREGLPSMPHLSNLDLKRTNATPIVMSTAARPKLNASLLSSFGSPSASAHYTIRDTVGAAE